MYQSLFPYCFFGQTLIFLRLTFSKSFHGPNEHTLGLLEVQVHLTEHQEVALLQKLLIWAISSLCRWLCVTLLKVGEPRVFSFFFFFYKHQQSRTNEPNEKKIFTSLGKTPVCRQHNLVLAGQREIQG